MYMNGTGQKYEIFDNHLLSLPYFYYDVLINETFAQTDEKFVKKQHKTEVNFQRKQDTRRKDKGSNTIKIIKTL